MTSSDVSTDAVFSSIVVSDLQIYTCNVFEGRSLGFVNSWRFTKIVFSDLYTGAVTLKGVLSWLWTDALFSIFVFPELLTDAMFPKIVVSELSTNAFFLTVVSSN